MEGDVFISNNSQKQISSEEKTFSFENSNFFLGQEDSSQGLVPDSGRRLNDYDFNILREEAYKDVTDELLKLEYKISRAEEDLKNLDSQIDAAYEINDMELAGTLTARRSVLATDLEHLYEIYNDKSLSARISGGITGFLKNKFNEKFGEAKTTLDGFVEKFSAYLPQKFSNIFELKKSLSKLESINKSVDELMTLQTPYGEAYDKYDQLSKYILKANSIQADIAKNMR